MKRLLVNIPIEPLPERYSEQWYHWSQFVFEMQSQIMGFELQTILGGTTSKKIKTGSFLDVVETNQYKMQQLIRILDVLKNLKFDEEVTLFFHDLWFPGLEAIAYVRDGLGLQGRVKIVGCLHAGTYDPYDWTARNGMRKWGIFMEQGWFEQIVDKIFVATQFHKELIVNTYPRALAKIEVTGFPIYGLQAYKEKEKEKIIVFPHRKDPEKQPDLFAKLQELVEFEEELQWQFTKDVTSTKEEYYNLLAKSQVAISFANQETWGIAMQESVLLGCLPLVPDHLSYSEMYLDVFKYHSFKELQSKLENFIMSRDYYIAALYQQQDKILASGTFAFENMLRRIYE